MKNVFIFGLVFLVLLSSAFAAPSDVLTPDLYLKFEDNIVDTMGNYTMSGTGFTYVSSYPTYDISGDGSNKSYHAGSGSNQFTYLSGFSPGATYVIATWYNSDSASPNGDIWGADPETGTVDRLARIGLSSKSYVQGLTFSGSTPYFTTVGTTNVSDGNWNHICTIINGREMDIYVNGVFEVTNGVTGSANTGTTNLVVGGRKVGSNGANVGLDEFYVSYGSATSDNCLALYEYGYPAAEEPTLTPLFDITARNSYGNTSISEFKANVTFNGTTISARTTNTTITFNETYDLSGNNETLTNNGATYSNGEFYFNQSNNDYLDIVGGISGINGANSLTVCLRFKPTLASDNDFLILEQTVNTKWALFTQGNALQIRGDTAGDTVQWNGFNSSYNNVWSVFCGVLNDGATSYIYLDGDLKTSGTISSFTASTSDVQIGRYGTSGQPFDGYMDWVKVFNGSLNATQIAQEQTETVYNFENLVAYYPFQRIENATTVNATTYKDNWLLSDSVSNYATSSDLTSYLVQSQISLSAKQLITNNSISGNFTILGTNYSANQTINISAGDYNVTFNAPGYFTQTQQITVTSGTSEAFVISDVGNAQVNVSFYNLFGNASAVNVSGYIYNDTYGFNQSFDSTPSNYVAFNIVQDTTFTVVVNGELYALKEFQISTNSTYKNQTEYLTITNTVNIQIKNEITNAIINNVTFQLEFISSTNAFSVNTSNGTVYENLVMPETYEIRYFSTDNNDYKLRSYFFTLTNQSFNNITLYALNQNDGNITTADITFLILNTNLQPVENALVVVQRYFLSSNGFESVYSRYTNTDGEAYGTFETIDAFYKYLVYYNDNLEYTSSSEGTQFSNDQTITIYIDPSPADVRAIDSVLTMPNSLSFTALTNYSGFFEVSYTNPNLYQVCLEISNQTNILNTTCQATTSGTIQIGVTHDNTSLTTYLAQVLVLNPQLETYYNINSLTKTYWPQNILLNADLAATASFIVAFLMVGIMLLFYNHPVAGLIAQTTIFIVLAVLPIQLIQVSIITVGFILTLVLGVVFIAQKNR